MATTATASTDTMTVTIPKALAWRLKNACADSSGVWHQHWRESVEGKRKDLDAPTCALLSKEAWELWEILDAQGI